MSVFVNYMGILAEKAGNHGETIEKEGSKSSVIKHITEKHPEFNELSFVVAHNGMIVHGEAEFKNGDQITLIPPPPGG